MNDLFLIFFIIVTSLFLTELIRRYGISKNIVDTPNERSSHTVPTPHGGGLSIVLMFLVAVSFTDSLPNEVVWAFTGSGILIAVIGLWDDKVHIAARWRLLSHFVAAFWVLYHLGGVPEYHFFNYTFDLDWFGIGISAIVLVWLLNLFNFMDGIDGIAASETIFISSGGAFFSYLNGLNGLLFISIVLASSTIGFLILNWSPAKIFMGDVGSGFLGLMLGVIAYVSILKGGSIWIWLILFGIFIVDSGITLLRRIMNGDKWYEAHCSHAYQNAARKWGHKKVTVSTILINLVWLFPIAFLVHLNENLSLLLVFVAYLPLIAIALKYNAGMAVNH